ncbi:MAG: phosphotransferase [Lachnospiraceae bacterium]|nr:phosphotransferase [Butyrivibrio sp.]MCM1342797.1 phosphotransferase [Muribaculaceae bacterium]MCM1409939.1 phosphotransferase [Lachnospiraceae bacterium]
MNDRALGLLEQYGIEVRGTRKGRGAILCDTDQGCLIFKEYAGSCERIGLQDRVLKAVESGGRVAVEQIMPTTEGALFVQDNDGIRYILKTWKDGRECSIYDKGECMEIARLLARLHKSMTLPADTPGLPPLFSPEKEYDKHNKELKKVKKYLQQRSQKQPFEISLQNAIDHFLEQALAVTEEWNAYCAVKNKKDAEAAASGEPVAFCHGDYQYHNIIRHDGGWFLINFEKCISDSPVRDLYLLMRKLLEKSNWSIPLGQELLEEYEKESPMTAIDRIDLYYRLAYPEKFWKIANFYFNSGKAWIPGRNQEKLERLMAQEKEKQHFLEEVFRDVSALKG